MSLVVRNLVKSLESNTHAVGYVQNEMNESQILSNSFKIHPVLYHITCILYKAACMTNLHLSLDYVIRSFHYMASVQMKQHHGMISGLLMCAHLFNVFICVLDKRLVIRPKEKIFVFPVTSPKKLG